MSLLLTSLLLCCLCDAPLLVPVASAVAVDSAVDDVISAVGNLRLGPSCCLILMVSAVFGLPAVYVPGVPAVARIYAVVTDATLTPKTKITTKLVVPDGLVE